MKLKCLIFLEIIIAIIAFISGIANFYVGFEIIGTLDFFGAIFCIWAWLYNFIMFRKPKDKKGNHNYGKH